jgi:DNA topoisomerase-1
MANDPMNDIPDEARIAAAAGLAYLPADRPGWRRVRRGSGFSYVDQGNRPLSERRRRRVEALVIPPAWTDVWIAPETDAHLQATGYDKDGRRQYLYHPDWRVAADAAKFVRLSEFCRPLGRLRRQVDHDLRHRGDDWPCAALVRLIDESLIRPGSLRHLRTTGSVGATTLGVEHLDVSRHVVHLQFEGKGAIEHDIEVHDPLLAKTISRLLDEARPGEPIFTDGNSAPVDSERVNEYVRTHAGPLFTAKDLRTWGATCIVAENLARATSTRSADDDTAREGAVKLAIEQAAERLGNTATVCRASYVSPAVIESFRDGQLREAWRASRSSRWLSRTDRAVSRVLEA